MKIKIYPKVSLVLPCYNAGKFLPGCLNSLARINYPRYEVVVIDDRSTDGSYQLIKSFIKKKKLRNYKLIKNSKNRGASYTRNRGIRVSKGSLVGFVETDMQFTKDWLSKLVKFLLVNQEVSAVQSKVCDLYHRKLIQSTGVKFGISVFGVEAFGFKRARSSIKNSEKVGLGAVGSLFRKEMLNKIGNFDQMFGHNIDDIDLSWRGWLAGFTQMSVPMAITFHDTFKKPKDRSTPIIKSEIITHKIFRVFLKNYQWSSIILYTPVLIFYQLLRVTKNLLKGNIKPLIGFIGGWIWNFYYLNDSLRERKRIQSLRKLTDKEIIERVGYRGNFLVHAINFPNEFKSIPKY